MANLTGVERIAAERARQLAPREAGGEGWDAAHDRGHADELALAGATYALPSWRRVLRWAGFLTVDLRQLLWPWDTEWWKPKVPDDALKGLVNREDRIRELEKAGALIAAAIDAIQAEQPAVDLGSIRTDVTR